MEMGGGDGEGGGKESGCGLGENGAGGGDNSGGTCGRRGGGGGSGGKHIHDGSQGWKVVR